MKFMPRLFGFLFQLSVTLLVILCIKYIANFVFKMNLNWPLVDDIPFLPLILLFFVILFGILYEVTKRKARK
ncbi:hypothetical protein K0019_03195 [Staphylococcus massiliensis]|uniref:Uncharacterized protein n=2 Tax=Staphylococcus massiliensis TaxID=555791 RepID=K9B8G0_9STAP|nr:hypothetical protein C273_02163 [Staphylococcus massiliensis S46]MCG3399206.1 hypothetical protein [Staphylococcus massiliensis]MCG3402258.1 hypothetical protein [Staphylococcus massiliensis]MCG3412775.1 hypothetical protein [Staphylococcus massiliensis]POA00297.1 hypothetical protein CD133_04805 [Staphylococcus massiliensis CCUG 55927]